MQNFTHQKFQFIQRLGTLDIFADLLCQQLSFVQIFQNVVGSIPDILNVIVGDLNVTHSAHEYKLQVEQQSHLKLV